MKRRPYLYFLSNTVVITVQGALFGVHVLQFRSTCSKYSRIELFADGVRTAKTAKVSSRENLSTYGIYKLCEDLPCQSVDRGGEYSHDVCASYIHDNIMETDFSTNGRCFRDSKSLHRLEFTQDTP